MDSGTGGTKPAAYSLVLRLCGVVLLVVAWRIATATEPMGRDHAGHEPATIYGLCLLAFLCASSGAALLAHGRALFGTAQTGALWSRPPETRDREPDSCSHR